MSDIAIKIENLSKQYRLGNIGTGTLTHDLKSWWASARGKEDPNLQIGLENKLGEKGGDFVYALKDINLEIKKGDIVGVIGKNGAGKSTLLKILSRVTTPTTGSIDLYGRIASLLEVGTGFHPELTGRENIFLNGAIMGMSKQEIKLRFDEIVEFAGVGKYIDTPVKRYSSGMYVRLGFAVAAHLEPEILIVDEVLAVGDAEFQKKAIGKMQDVSKNQGRTVLFVSHNMEAILKLCSNCVYLKNGTVESMGSSQQIINTYLSSDKIVNEIINVSSYLRPSDIIPIQYSKYNAIKLVNNNNKGWKIKYKEPLHFQFEIEVKNVLKDIEFGLAIFTNSEFEIVSSLSSDSKRIERIEKGKYIIDYIINDFSLLPNSYLFSVGIRSERGLEDYLPLIGHFEVLINNESASEKANSRKGILVPKNTIKISEINK
jgi:lipopolysaccharide transport system ATP-binding protein